MPETPDFDQIARAVTTEAFTDASQAELTTDIAAALRLVWNARGAADVALLTRTVSGFSADLVARELRTLDR